MSLWLWCCGSCSAKGALERGFETRGERYCLSLSEPTPPKPAPLLTFPADVERCARVGGAVATSSPNPMGDMDLPIYHGPISRQRCEELLGKRGKDGAYLIRDSETIQGALCLCVYKQKIVYTYRILQTHTGYYTLQTSAGAQELYFKTLLELIRHYKKKNQGLATRLRYSVKRKQMEPDQVDDSADAHDYENVESSEYVVVLPD